MICKLTHMSTSIMASKYSLQVSFQSFQSSMDVHGGLHIRHFWLQNSTLSYRTSHFRVQWLLHAMRDVVPAADHKITLAQNYSDISKSSNREFCCDSNTQVAQPQLQDQCRYLPNVPQQLLLFSFDRIWDLLIARPLVYALFTCPLLVILLDKYMLACRYESLIASLLKGFT